MKTFFQVVSRVAVVAVLLGVPAGNAHASSSWSVGVGYNGGNAGFAYRGGNCAPRYGSGWGGWCGYRFFAPPVYYYSASPVVYYAPPPPQSTVVYSTPVPATSPQVQQPAKAEPMSVADVKTLAKAGVSDEVIISLVRSSQTIFRLSTTNIIDLKDGGVSQRVIDFMINTANPK